MGDRKEADNPFRWDEVRLNLPGSASYNPSLPRVCKWNSLEGAIACDCNFFCDDFRIIGPNEKQTKLATHRLETTMSYLGVQDATRKRRSIIGHVVVSLVGFFKAETGERKHVLSLANTTHSGIGVRVWLERIIRILIKEKKKECPAFCDEDDFILMSRDIEKVMHPIIESLQGYFGLEQSLPKGIEVEKFYRCDRSFRRGAVNTALVGKVKREAIEFVNRWRSFEQHQGKSPSLPILWHYADGESTRPLQLDFTSSV